MNQEYIKRINFVSIIFIIFAIGIGWRLFQKQVSEHGNYLAKAEDQYIVKKNVTPERGKIYFSDMYPIATNSRLYQIVATPVNIREKDDAAQKMASILGMEEKEVFEKINNNKPYALIQKRLSEDQGQKIADLKISGVVVVPEPVRFYPEKEMASHILGFVDASGEGRYGLEGFYNEELKGSGGQISGERDTKGRIYDIYGQVEPQNGVDLVLTVDRDIQYEAENVIKEAVEKFEADSGSITIMEPKTGKVLAMAGVPNFDPNNFNKVPQEEQSVFVNPVISSNWEPGSVFKPLTMSAAIDQGKVAPETEGVFSNMVEVQGYKIHTAQDKAFGRETMTNVLENSDNVAMVWVSEQLGKDLLFNYVRDYGFGKKTGIEMDSESSGDVLELKQWRDITRATVAFGQGISVTPIQLLTAVSAIANKGVLMKPFIIDKIIDSTSKEDKTNPVEVRRVISEETAKKVSNMMVSVVENGHGKKAGVEGFRVAGKTGTAQVPKPGGGYYTDRHNGSFVGFAPADDPKFSMLIRLDNPKNVEWAEESAAPTFGKMAKWLLTYMQLEPTK